jgi:hypothetical protein
LAPASTKSSPIYKPKTLAIMHGSSFTGDCPRAPNGVSSRASSCHLQLPIPLGLTLLLMPDEHVFGVMQAMALLRRT